jgi:hypothetical protein
MRCCLVVSPRPISVIGLLVGGIDSDVKLEVRIDMAGSRQFRQWAFVPLTDMSPCNGGVPPAGCDEPHSWESELPNSFGGSRLASWEAGVGVTPGAVRVWPSEMPVCSGGTSKG